MGAIPNVPVRDAPWHPDIPDAVECRERLARLTGRQREIVELLARGWTRQQIARRLGISARTVSGHLYDPAGICARLEASPPHLVVALYYRAMQPHVLAVVPDPKLGEAAA